MHSGHLLLDPARYSSISRHSNTKVQSDSDSDPSISNISPLLLPVFPSKLLTLDVAIKSFEFAGFCTNPFSLNPWTLDRVRRHLGHEVHIYLGPLRHLQGLVIPIFYGAWESEHEIVFVLQRMGKAVRYNEDWDSLKDWEK